MRRVTGSPARAHTCPHNPVTHAIAMARVSLTERVAWWAMGLATAALHAVQRAHISAGGRVVVGEQAEIIRLCDDLLAQDEAHIRLDRKIDALDRTDPRREELKAELLAQVAEWKAERAQLAAMTAYTREAIAIAAKARLARRLLPEDRAGNPIDTEPVLVSLLNDILLVAGIGSEVKA